VRFITMLLTHLTVVMDAQQCLQSLDRITLPYLDGVLLDCGWHLCMLIVVCLATAMSRLDLLSLANGRRCIQILARSGTLRLTLASASHCIAWKFIPPLCRECGGWRQTPAQLAAQVSSSLLRFGSIHLDWSEISSDVDLQADIIRAASLPLGTLSIRSYNFIRAQHVRCLAGGLQQSGTAAQLTHLHLGNQSFGDEGAAAVGELLPLCPRLNWTCIDAASAVKAVRLWLPSSSRTLLSSCWG
jgi:hypothetical protein